MGLWVEKSGLDQLDKHLSGFVFNLTFPGWLEMVLSFPGAFMAFPTCWFGCTAHWLAFSISPTPALFLSATILTLVGAFSFYGGLAGLFDSGTAVKRLMIPLFICSVYLLQHFLPDLHFGGQASIAAREAAYSFLSAACVVNAVLFAVKKLVGRLRPCAALDISSKRTAMMLAYINPMKGPGHATDSFCSADVAVMATLVYHMDGPSYLRAALLATTMFGRLYFWAHHLVDVVCGAICGLAVCEALDVMDFGSTWKEATACFILFLAVAVAYLKRQPAAAKVRSSKAPGRFQNGFEVRR